MLPAVAQTDVAHEELPGEISQVEVLLSSLCSQASYCRQQVDCFSGPLPFVAQ
jgi:hypothetical protein